MNRRDYFKTIGIPSLVLPFVGLLKLPQKSEYCSLMFDGKEIARACSYPVSIGTSFLNTDDGKIYKWTGTKWRWTGWMTWDERAYKELNKLYLSSKP